MLALALGGVACGRDRPTATRALVELERLSFVPAGPARLEGFDGPGSDCSLEEAILLDRFEFTRGDWLHYDPAAARAACQRLGEDPASALGEGALDLPAFLSWDQAAALAERRGMRLPRAKEWIHVAVGRRSLVYPYGPLPQQSWANTLELGFGAPTPVGTFESGKSRRFDCYDLLGNVWEWAADVVPGYADYPSAIGWQPIGGDRLASALGGAFDSRTRRTFGSDRLRFHAVLLDRGTVSLSVGARMVATADDYLWAMAGRWGDGADARQRVRAVGARWSATSGSRVVLSFLQQLFARPGAPESLGWLLEGARAPEGRAGP